MASLSSRATLDDVRSILTSFSGLFERDRLLGPRQVVVTLLVMIRDGCGYRRGLATVSAMMGAEFGWKELPPSAGSFSKARHKLLPAEMLAMYRLALESKCAVAARDRWRWRGFRLVAADGSRFLLPAHDRLIDAYSRPRVKGGEAYQPQLLQMTLWDVGACQPLAWCQRPCRGKGNGERALLMELLPSLSSTDLLLLDRGFPSRRMLFELVARGIPFVARMTAGTASDFTEVATFLASGQSETDATFTYRDPDCSPALAHGLRLVRDVDESGNGCVLVTSLVDRHAFTAQELIHIYYRRWGIETAFRDMKMRYQIEGFHGTTPQLVEQEIIALMFLLLIESLIEEAALSTIPASERGNGNEDRPKRCNRAALGDRILNLLTLAGRAAKCQSRWQEYRRGITAIAHDRSRVRRPGRERPRQCLSQFGRWRFRGSPAKAA
jgi:IS4 transposase